MRFPESTTGASSPAWSQSNESAARRISERCRRRPTSPADVIIRVSIFSAHPPLWRRTSATPLWWRYRNTAVKQHPLAIPLTVAPPRDARYRTSYVCRSLSIVADSPVVVFSFRGGWVVHVRCGFVNDENLRRMKRKDDRNDASVPSSGHQIFIL